MIDASWVIADKATGQAVMETFNFELVQFVNLNKYTVYTISAWLAKVQQNINAA